MIPAVATSWPALRTCWLHNRRLTWNCNDLIPRNLTRRVWSPILQKTLLEEPPIGVFWASHLFEGYLANPIQSNWAKSRWFQNQISDIMESNRIDIIYISIGIEQDPILSDLIWETLISSLIWSTFLALLIFNLPIRILLSSHPIHSPFSSINEDTLIISHW